MSDSDSSTREVPKRIELKKLHFQKSQELKGAKSKNEKKLIEKKFLALERQLLDKSGQDEMTTSQPPTAPVVFYSDTPKAVSKSQRRKEEKAIRESVKREGFIAAVGDGSAEAELREAENRSIMQRIPKGFEIQQIPADGDCMFTAICLACTDLTSAHLREMIVEYLEAHEEEFLPFIIGGDDDVSDFSDYLASVRTHRWGGHLELEVASRVLQRQIQVYTSSGILEFGLSGTCPPVRLSFHEHQLTSNHYNAIVPVLQEESSVA